MMSGDGIFESLSREAYETACKRGQYHTVPVFTGNPSANLINSMAIMGGITHLIDEANEVDHAYRHEKRYSAEELREVMETLYKGGNAEFMAIYEDTLHNTLDDELADVVINALSLWKALGRNGQDIYRMITNKLDYNDLRKD